LRRGVVDEEKKGEREREMRGLEAPLSRPEVAVMRVEKRQADEGKYILLRPDLSTNATERAGNAPHLLRLELCLIDLISIRFLLGLLRVGTDRELPSPLESDLNSVQTALKQRRNSVETA